jgi:hypothetical protein
LEEQIIARNPRQPHELLAPKGAVEVNRETDAAKASSTALAETLMVREKISQFLKMPIRYA